MRRSPDFQPHTILKPRQIARLLGCTEKHAQTIMSSGELHATKIGRDWVTTYTRVIGYLERRIDNEQPKRAKPAALPPGVSNVQAVVVKPTPARSIRRADKPRLTPEALAALAKQHNIPAPPTKSA